MQCQLSIGCMVLSEDQLSKQFHECTLYTHSTAIIWCSIGIMCVVQSKYTSHTLSPPVCVQSVYAITSLQAVVTELRLISSTSFLADVDLVFHTALQTAL